MVLETVAGATNLETDEKAEKQIERQDDDTKQSRQYNQLIVKKCSEVQIVKII